jgi:type I restriction enzyme S subunit
VVAITEQTLDGSLIGSPSLIPQIDAEKSIISQDLAKIVPDEIPNVFFYHLFNSNRFDDYTTSVATGTTVYHLSLTSIGEFKFALPPMEDINKFVSVVEDFHEMKYNMIDEISRLENLRDTLLPKLVSGEVRVNDINLDDLEVGSEV